MPQPPDNSQVILEDVIQQFKSERAPEMSDAEYFEVFTAEQLLKNYSLSYDEIEAGIVDGEHDGGVDSIFAFVNGELITEDFDPTPFKRDVKISLHIIQSKTSKNYSEDPINKLISVTRNLLDLSRDIDSLAQYNADVRRKFKEFRTVYRALASRFPEIEIRYHLAGKRPDVPIPANFVTKANELKEAAEAHFQGQQPAVSVEILGASELLQLARQRPRTTFELRCVKSLVAENGAIALVRLSELNAFLRDESERVRSDIFESNVRDFQGSTEVNAEIKNTLESEDTPDFWWLNNGVTILASRSSINGDVISIADPQIVNGLQTSTQIANYFDHGGEDVAQRSVMVKVVSSEDELTRDKIIKATNSQNPIQPATLRATDKIQRDIEESLRASGMYYDRRKNFYKNEGKPADRIISIPLMAQILMTVLLGRPDDARARPSSLIKDDSIYRQLFSEELPIGLYLTCARLIKRVDATLRATDMSSRDKNNLRFYVAMMTVWRALGGTAPTAQQLAVLDISALDQSVVDEALRCVNRHYSELGATDQVAKGQELKKALLQEAMAS